MLSRVVVFTLICSLALSAFPSDDYEYGTPADLKGLTTYYLNTQTDTETRDKVAAKVRVETDRLHLASVRDEARIFVDVLGDDHNDDGASFVIWVAGKEGRHRVIQKFSYTHSNFPKLRPTSRFARDFARMWRDAQDASSK